jgi:SAM-dependent methyltransferase
MPTDFDQWAAGYDQSPLQLFFRAAHRAVDEHARRWCPRPRRVLDVGCGTGQLLRAASFPDAILIGLDPSAGMLLAGRSGPAELVRARAEELPFATATFDLVLSTSSYRHWSNPSSALREVARILAPTGWFVLGDVFSVRPRSPWSRRTGGVPFDTGRALARAGLTTVTVEQLPGFGPAPTITVVIARPRAATWADRPKLTHLGGALSTLRRRVPGRGRVAAHSERPSVWPSQARKPDDEPDRR